MRITPENVVNLTQEQVDQIYGRLTAGPIPDGQHEGDLFFARGDRISPQADCRRGCGRFSAGSRDASPRPASRSWRRSAAKCGRARCSSATQRVLRNMIEDKPLLRPLVGNPDRTDGMRPMPRDGPARPCVQNDKVWLLFPAKLYCGQSLVDGRRESVIVDYHYSDEIKGYRPSPDSLAGRGGLRIRDEIRMIRPGFYLGRAYTNRMFLLNFTLYNEEVANRDGPAFADGKAVAEDCWPGEQARKIVAR